MLPPLLYYGPRAEQAPSLGPVDTCCCQAREHRLVDSRGLAVHSPDCQILARSIVVRVAVLARSTRE